MEETDGRRVPVGPNERRGRGSPRSRRVRQRRGGGGRRDPGSPIMQERSEEAALPGARRSCV